MKSSIDIMNRIVLIGNGFDRSLGFPTSYSNFLDWIFLTTLQNLSESESSTKTGRVEHFYEDELLELKANRSVILKSKELIEARASYSTCLEELSSGAKLKIGYKCKFIKVLFDAYGLNKWVDIEQLYFEELKEIKEDEVDEFNTFFLIIKAKLAEYLGTISMDVKKLEKAYNSYRKQFFGPHLRYNSTMRYWEESQSIPISVYFVNFNYTHILSHLLERGSRSDDDNDVVNHIHGDLYDPRNIIFGYGNESGDEFLRLEKKGIKFLENIKSNNYFFSTHYKDLLVNLNATFEVYIYGHSCGLSDNILLRTIMEHSNCQQIRIFYKNDSEGRNNFKETFMNLSRAFSNKELLRKKVIAKLEDDFIRQFD